VRRDGETGGQIARATDGKRYEYAVGASTARPVCRREASANNRMRQQPIQPGTFNAAFLIVAAAPDLPAANCPPMADRTANGRPYGGERKKDRPRKLNSTPFVRQV